MLKGGLSSIEPISTIEWHDVPAELNKFRPEGQQGVFTTMRVNNNTQHKILAFNMHIDRLVNLPGCSMHRSLLEAQINEFQRSHIDHKYTASWLSLTLLLAPKPPDDFFIVCALKEIPDPPISCSVLVKSVGPRPNPEIKSAGWIEERKAFKDPAFNETILIDGSSGRCFEGLSSNFAVIDLHNRLLTAPPSVVLAGSVMKMVMEAADELGIDVVLDTPDISDISSWKAAFITSTSRLVLPITEITLEDMSLYKIPSLECNELTRLKHKIEEIISE